MKLYKNVDIKDLESILEKGILSLNESGNDNWGENYRANNSRDVVYLFNPLTEVNSYADTYGMALIEVEVEATKREILKGDPHINDYEEYTCSRVLPEQIVNIYVPKYVTVDNDKVTPCEVEFDYFTENGFKKAPQKIIDIFFETTEVISYELNYFRGILNNRFIDVKNVKYIIK